MSERIQQRGRRAGAVPKRWLALIPLIAAVVVLLVLRPHQSTESAADNSRTVAVIEPPAVDKKGFESQVAEKIRDARAAVLWNPLSAAHWGRLGMIFDAHNLVEEAVICYRQAEALDSSDFRWPYMAAISMPDSDPEPVIDLLRRARQLRPDYAPINLRLGNWLLLADRTEAAAVAFERALVIDRRSSHAMLGLGRIAALHEDADAARVYLERAAGIRPNHREVHAALAQVYRALELSDLAGAAAQRAAMLPGKTRIADPARTEVFFEGVNGDQLAEQGRRLLQGRRYEAAIHKLSRSLKARPDNAVAHMNLGLAYLSVGQPQSAVRELEEAVRLAPHLKGAQQALELAATQLEGSAP